MSTTHRTVLFCGVMMASLLGGCAPGVESNDVLPATSKQSVVGAPGEEGGGDPGQAPAACVQGELCEGACVDLLSDDKSQEMAACAALGLTLGGISSDESGCPQNSGKVSYVCCPAAPPASPSDSCQADKVGLGACEELSALEAEATARCALLGQALADFSPLDGCPEGQAGIAMISCCPASP